ncbi:MULTISPECIES: PAS domain S-box protein [unclassified Mesorhizobium]|uniref:PAS domain S-box protein n=1 Tax=unclassified Mesorhizobium TaxID=325217 RepID=UPI000FC9AE12|nr:MULTISPECIES: PAS domain S-box protein [unclassified Mesorhizobium]RUU68007.1 PAS domain S-box protein [Mesorhizobium sp. M7A.T.Ca.TU.009.01.1.1]RUV52473.1 PAS domain S-box protein [Mesorhizobium sp. M7A.F.Ca.MR.228.00.0.0]RUT84920.1 PAS domain S-box protein [Mesorhizobium sp. M7A.T.Ca.US.000.02.1.1]RUT88711.1 PAS domain S-box protein [Mesorhizobium sp. M7A.T.Ca.US.000.02.2.1]RUU01603.1 PAS domain S-box protein [Mesorhizobium sp. M7A.T.Ca.TU.009.02.1.1]
MNELPQANVVAFKDPEMSGTDSPNFDYQDFFENGAVALHLVSEDGIILHANTAELDLLGYPAEDYVGRHIADFYPDRPVIEDILERLTRGEKIARYPARLRARDGAIKHVEITSSGHFRDGKLINTRCFTVDVTDLERARTELRQQDNTYHQILDALPVAIYTTDQDGTITYYNRAAAELAGREPNVGKDKWCVTFKLFTADGKELPHDECPMAIALNENRPVRNQEAVAQRPDGSFFPFLPYPTPLRDEHGTLIGAVNMLLDLTDRQRAEEAKQHLSAIVESSFDAIVSKDLNTIIKSWNQGAERLFGYTADEAIGQSVTMLIPDNHQDEEPRILERIRRGERVEPFETTRQRRDGSLVPVSLAISPVRNAAGQIVGASKIARDITLARESEQRIHMLMREVNHRVKNQYSVILSMIRETNKRSETPKQFEYQVRERIMALSRSHDLLVAADWKGATISDLLAAQAQPFPRGDVIAMSGPLLVLNANAVQYLGIAFHELATNSAKYGVLSADKGQISVIWTITGSGASRLLHLTWAETDGPEVQSIGQGGFGTVVLKRVAPAAVGGQGKLEHGPHGVTWSLEAPLTAVEPAVANRG